MQDSRVIRTRWHHRVSQKTTIRIKTEILTVDEGNDDDGKGAKVPTKALQTVIGDSDTDNFDLNKIER